MKKLLLSVCVLVGSINAMNPISDEVKKYLITSAETISLADLSENNVEVKELLKLPVPFIDGKTIKGDTWLHVFMRAQNTEIVKVLSDDGADWHAVNDDIESPYIMVDDLKDDNEFKMAIVGLISADVEEDTSWDDVGSDDTEDKNGEKEKKDVGEAEKTSVVIKEVEKPQEVLLEKVTLKGGKEQDEEVLSEQEKATKIRIIVDDSESESDEGSLGAKEKGKKLLSFDILNKLIPLPDERGIVEGIMLYLHTGTNRTFAIWRGAFLKNPKNVFEVQLSDDQNLGDWLLSALQNKSVNQKRAIDIAAVVGPYSPKDGDHPFLYWVLLSVLCDGIPEKLYEGFEGKAVINDKSFLNTLKTWKGKKVEREKCKRILELFSPKEEEGFDSSDSSGEDSSSYINEESSKNWFSDIEDDENDKKFLIIEDDENDKKFLTFDKMKDLIPENKYPYEDYDIASHTMKYLAEGDEFRLGPLKGMIRGAKQSNVFEVQLSNGQSLGGWLLLVMEYNDVPKDRALEVAALVGPYAMVNKKYPFLHKVIDAVLKDNDSEELYHEIKFKLSLDDAILIDQLDNREEKAKRILELYEPREEEEDPLRLDPHDDDGVKPIPISLIGKLFYSSCAITIAYVAWYYLGYSSSEKKNKGLPGG